ncbi:motility associated factor glycosyltransferase family protein [bacterium]|nr:motility associated factor glycosyltransferase family protein [bacterium]
MAQKSAEWQKNIRTLKKMHAPLSQLLNQIPDSTSRVRCSRSKSGAATMEIEALGRTHVLHSRYDPEKEAKDILGKLSLPNPMLTFFYGFGCGHLVRQFKKVIPADKWGFIVIVEKDLEFLKAAFEFEDFSDLLDDSRVIWLCGLEKERLSLEITQMMRDQGTQLQVYLKAMAIIEHPILCRLENEYYAAFTRSLQYSAQQTIITYGNDPKDSLEGLINILGNLRNIVEKPGLIQAKDRFKGIPGILVSTGPSLDKNIDQLKDAEEKGVIICADSAFKVLLDHGITPHIVATLERVSETIPYVKGINQRIKDEVWLAACPVVLPEFYETYGENSFVVFREFAHFKWLPFKKGTLLTGPSCSNMAFEILEFFGCNPIILVGQDCSFPSTEKTHAQGADEAANWTKRDLPKFTHFQVKGNYQENVLTYGPLYQFLQFFNKDVSEYKGACINATEGGAYILGTEVMTLKEALEKNAAKKIPISKLIREVLSTPKRFEIMDAYGQFSGVIKKTQAYLTRVIQSCKFGVEGIDAFEQEMSKREIKTPEDFLQKMTEEELFKIVRSLATRRAEVLTKDPLFYLFMMHIVQSYVVSKEMEFNELPSLFTDRRKQFLRMIRMHREWFETISQLTNISSETLAKAAAFIENRVDTLRQEVRV